MKFTYGMAVAVVGAGLLAGCISAPQGGAKVAYYNGGYGEYHGGFWGTDGVFYFYTDASHVKLVRDDAGNFQMTARNGFHPVTARPRERHYERRVVQSQASNQ
jgi:hypothetical protein